MQILAIKSQNFINNVDFLTYLGCHTRISIFCIILAKYIQTHLILVNPKTLDNLKIFGGTYTEKSFKGYLSWTQSDSVELFL